MTGEYEGLTEQDEFGVLPYTVVFKDDQIGFGLPEPMHHFRTFGEAMAVWRPGAFLLCPNIAEVKKWQSLSTKT